MLSVSLRAATGFLHDRSRLLRFSHTGIAIRSSVTSLLPRSQAEQLLQPVMGVVDRLHRFRRAATVGVPLETHLPIPLLDRSRPIDQRPGLFSPCEAAPPL